MRRNCNFEKNPAFVIGLMLMSLGSLLRQEVIQGLAQTLVDFTCGAGIGLTFIGLLYGSPKTRPLFDKFHAFKLRLLGRENAN